LAIEVSKAQNDIPSAKRDGDSMARDVRSCIHLDENTSSWRAATTLRQEMLLNELEMALEEDEEDVVAKFERLRAECKVPDMSHSKSSVTKVDRLRVNVIADVLSLPQPVSIWEAFLPTPDLQSHLLPIPLDKENLTSKGLHPNGDV
jgi:Zn-dependent M16 (insulinase) family peptidase